MASPLPQTKSFILAGMLPSQVRRLNSSVVSPQTAKIAFIFSCADESHLMVVLNPTPAKIKDTISIGLGKLGWGQLKRICQWLKLPVLCV